MLCGIKIYEHRKQHSNNAHCTGAVLQGLQTWFTHDMHPVVTLGPQQEMLLVWILEDIVAIKSLC